MAKKYLSLERLAEYDELIKDRIDDGDSNTLSSANLYTDSKVANITNGTTVVANATHADSADESNHANTATKATQDGDGNDISSTYETKTDANAKLTEARDYAYSLASGKADTTHIHAIKDVGGLQDILDKNEEHINDTVLHWTDEDRTIFANATSENYVNSNNANVLTDAGNSPIKNLVVTTKEETNKIYLHICGKNIADARIVNSSNNSILPAVLPFLLNTNVTSNELSLSKNIILPKERLILYVNDGFKFKATLLKDESVALENDYTNTLTVDNTNGLYDEMRATFTTDEGELANANDIKFMVEIGDVATGYEPYRGYMVIRESDTTLTTGEIVDLSNELQNFNTIYGLTNIISNCNVSFDYNQLKETETSDYLYSAGGKVVTTLVTPDEYGLMSPEDKAKLDSIEYGANNFTFNYEHPETHDATMIVEDSEHRFVTDSQIAIWDGKADNTLATTANDGLMSSNDKKKLDGIKPVTYTENGLMYSSDKKKLDGIEAVTDEEVSEMLDEILKTRIESSEFEGDTTITSLSFPFVTSIGDCAFLRCSNLTSLETSNLTSVENNAFADCTSLTTLDTGSLTTIEDYTFSGCESLTTLDTSNVISIGDNAFANCTSLTTLDTNNVTSIGDYAFDNCKNLASLDTSNLTSIGIGGFRGCSSLTTLDTSNVTSIEDEAFSYCSNLTTLDTSNITSIGNSTFEKCISLEELDTSNVTTIGDRAFYGCSSLNNVDTSNVTSIGNSAFERCGNLTTLDTSNVTTIGNRAFHSSSNLTNIDISKVTSIGEFAFCWCEKLTSLDTSNLTTISQGSFSNCTGLTTLNLSNLTAIPTYSFNNCSNLTTLNTPNVTSIGENAFQNCKKLTSLDTSNVISLSDRSFYECRALKALNLSKLTGEIPYVAFWYCANLTEIVLGGTTMISLLNENAFANTPFANGTGSIWVPAELKDAYLADTNWSKFSACIKAIGVDGTPTI